MIIYICITSSGALRFALVSNDGFTSSKDNAGNASTTVIVASFTIGLGQKLKCDNASNCLHI